MEGINCNGEGGWTRVAYVNMSQPGATCPDGLIQKNYSNINYPLCSRPPRMYEQGCISTTFNTLGLNYSNVCGKVRGYQYGSPDSFYSLEFDNIGIDGVYAEGVSITHGKNPRKHIWTYAAALQENRADSNGCPCSIGYSGGVDPTSTFIGSHYYCESGLDPGVHWDEVLFVADPLWDGKQCDYAEATCCPANSKMPWFYRSLGTHTRDGIELRLCGNHGHNDEDTPLDIIELYVM